MQIFDQLILNLHILVQLTTLTVVDQVVEIVLLNLFRRIKQMNLDFR